MKLHYPGEIIVGDYGICKVIDVDDNNICTAETIIPKAAFIEAFEKYIYNPTHNEWIPVSKQLPDKYDSYLVMWRSLTEGYPDRLFYEICEYVPEEDEWDRIEQAGEAGAEIIAWMPLPEPYKEGGADNEKTDK